jgi:hypothetical protein
MEHDRAVPGKREVRGVCNENVMAVWRRRRHFPGGRSEREDQEIINLCESYPSAPRGKLWLQCLPGFIDRHKITRRYKDRFMGFNCAGETIKGDFAVDASTSGYYGPGNRAAPA